MLYLDEDASKIFFYITNITYLTGLLSPDHYFDRLLVLQHISKNNDPIKEKIKNIFSIDEWISDDIWLTEPLNINENDCNSNKILENKQENTNGIFHFCSTVVNLNMWEFHHYDPDYFPSIPHGHYNGNKQPKLDVYLGWTYNGSRQIGRVSRKDIIALWNDTKFRQFAIISIEWYLNKYKQYKGWRVKNPKRLPKKH